MRLLKQLLFVLLVMLVAVSPVLAAANEAHVWEMQELTFTATNNYKNPYTDVIVWVDLVGPGFNKRVYGFWDGGLTFHVRLVATKPGIWKWQSGSNMEDQGFNGKTGSFTAIDWTEAEKKGESLATWVYTAECKPPFPRAY